MFRYQYKCWIYANNKTNIANNLYSFHLSFFINKLQEQSLC